MFVGECVHNTHWRWPRSPYTFSAASQRSRQPRSSSNLRSSWSSSACRKTSHWERCCRPSSPALFARRSLMRARAWCLISEPTLWSTARRNSSAIDQNDVKPRASLSSARRGQVFWRSPRALTLDSSRSSQDRSLPAHALNSATALHPWPRDLARKRVRRDTGPASRTRCLNKRACDSFRSRGANGQFLLILLTNRHGSQAPCPSPSRQERPAALKGLTWRCGQMSILQMHSFLHSDHSSCSCPAASCPTRPRTSSVLCGRDSSFVKVHPKIVPQTYAYLRCESSMSRCRVGREGMSHNVMNMNIAYRCGSSFWMYSEECATRYQ